jgi:hypothetical protein
MRQGDGTDLLGPSDPRSASIGVIYVAPNDDRQSVLTAILTQDKLGFEQVIVVLPDQNKAFQRPIDFEGLKNMRRGLKSEIVFIAPSGPGPAVYARQRRFPVYTSLEAFSQSTRLETFATGNSNSHGKRGLFGLGRKQEIAAGVAVASVTSSETLDESISTLPMNGTLNSSPYSYSSNSDQEENGTSENNTFNGKHASAFGVAAGADVLALADGENKPLTDHILPEQSEKDTEPHVDADLSALNRSENGATEASLAETNGLQKQNDAGPAIITFSATTPGSKITRNFPVPPTEVVAAPVVASELSSQRNESSEATTNKKSNTGKMVAVGVGAAAVSLAAMKAGSAAGGSIGQPPSGSAPGGPGGGGVGGTSRGTRVLLAILLGVLTVLLIGGITVAALPGGFNNLPHVIPGTTATATVTITPDSKNETNIYQIIGVTGTPNPSMREVSARIISATSPSQSKTVQSTGSIPGTRASGALTFLNTTTSNISFGSVILRGASGVSVTFNGPVTVDANPGFLTITGFAVNVGSSGNIGALDITGSCCASGITVKNGSFGGGQNPQPNSVVQQSDINGAASALTASLTPSTQTALQKEVHAGEQVIPNTMRCTSAVSANHVAGDHAPNVTVIVSVTCKEEVYDQSAALIVAANLLAKQASTDLGPNYALTGNIVADVTKVTVVDTKGTLAILVRAEGVWVYQFSESVLQGFANHIANMSNQDATNYLMSQPGVKAVKIDNPNGNTMPDAAHIKIVVETIPGVTGSPTPGSGTATVTPGGPTVVPSGAATSPAKPTPTTTQGLGGS